MSEEQKKFHEFALKSILFKGRSDWYFCFLKSEKIAHVLAVLANGAGDMLTELAREAGEFPHTVAHFAAGEVDLAVLLADIFSLLSSVRLAGARGAINSQNASVLLQEYEHLAQKLAEGSRLSPFVSPADFSVPRELEEAPAPRLPTAIIKDNKGHSKGHPLETTQGHSRTAAERVSKILDFVKKNKGVSIKDISVIVKGCSEKTIQRELSLLIHRGLVRKVGERRWSLYLPA